MANIDKLARFIASLGSLNEYGSTIAQTKKALETENLTYLSSQTDQVIFQDALKGIKAIQKTGFNVDGIIAPCGSNKITQILIKAENEFCQM